MACPPVRHPIAVATITLIDDVATFPLGVRHRHAGLWTQARVTIALVVARPFVLLLITLMLTLLGTVLRLPLLRPVLLLALLAALWRAGLSNTGQGRAEYQRGADH